MMEFNWHQSRSTIAWPEGCRQDAGEAPLKKQPLVMLVALSVEYTFPRSTLPVCWAREDRSNSVRSGVRPKCIQRYTIQGRRIAQGNPVFGIECGVARVRSRQNTEVPLIQQQRSSAYCTLGAERRVAVEFSSVWDQCTTKQNSL